jgi:hypothetical protein
MKSRNSVVLAAFLLAACFSSCSKEEKEVGPVAVTGVSVSPTTLSLTVDQKSTLTATVSPENANDKSVRWSSNATSIATVDIATGEVTAIAPGTAEITATTTDGSKKAVCTVTVTIDIVAVTGVGLNKSEITLMVGDTETLTATVQPENATNKTVTWNSSDPAIASVNASTGEVTAASVGTAKITVTTEDGNKMSECTVTVTASSLNRLVLDGYTTGTVSITYSDGSTETATGGVGNNILYFTLNRSKVIRSIKIGSDAPILIGRKADSDLSFKLDADGGLALRDKVSGKIPIGSYAEFQLINTDDPTLDDDYQQEADLDLLGEEWTPISVFSGIFDGNNFTIANLKINTSEISERGIFGHNVGTLRNIRLVSGSVTGNEVTGGVCGLNGNGGIIDGCSNTGCTVLGRAHIAGVCGHNNGGTVKNSYNAADVTITSWTGGGVVGRNTGEIVACYNAGLVNSTAPYAGGVCGNNAGTGTIVACYNTGDLIVSQYSNGGICGHNEGGAIIASYSTGSITGGWDTGGVCGRDQTRTITACYYKPGVGASYGIGGLGLADPANPATLTPTNDNALPFTSAQWPTVGINAAWGTGDGSENKYWKSLGNYNQGEYPGLWFEE